MIELLKNLRRYKDLLLVLIYKEITIRYSQTVIGVSWAVLQPVALMLVFTFIFTIVTPTKVSEYPQMIFFYAAIVPWTFFSSSLNGSITSFSDQFDLITNIYFPREVLPISRVVVAFIDNIFAMILYVIFLFYFKIRLTWYAIWFIPLMLQLIIFTISVTFILSSLNVFYRDVKIASAFLINIWFYITPVFYSIDKLSLKMKLLVFINPLTFIVENMRRCVVEGRDIIGWQFALISVFVLVLFYISIAYFRAIERKFADVI